MPIASLAPRLRLLLAALLLPALLGACASLPPPVVQAPVAAIGDYAATPLNAIAQRALAPGPQSGFRLLPYGPTSFASRIELAKLATRSLDVQYYLLAGDNTGRALMRALRDAAARGVRVRLLVDDLYTTGEDELLLGLASHPNVEVRLFNPSRPAAAATSRASPRRPWISSASTGACTTSCSWPTTPPPWPADATWPTST